LRESALSNRNPLNIESLKAKGRSFDSLSIKPKLKSEGKYVRFKNIINAESDKREKRNDETPQE
jgi:hypothetical protein